MEDGPKWKQMFSSSQLSLSHQDPLIFVRSAWQPEWGSALLPFLLYRLLVTALFLAILGWSWSVFWYGGMWFVFLTNWGFLMCALQALVGTLLVLAAYWKQKTSDVIDSMFDMSQFESSMPFSYKVYWLLYNIAVTVAIFITILYWTLLYDPAAEPTEFDGPFLLNVATHACNSALCLLELLVCGVPSRLLHAFQPVLFTIAYLVFNVIYWAAGGLGLGGASYVYPVLDWDNSPGLGVGIAFGGAALLVLVHAAVCGLAGLRGALVRRLRRRKKNNIIISTLPAGASAGNANKGYVP